MPIINKDMWTPQEELQRWRTERTEKESTMTDWADKIAKRFPHHNGQVWPELSPVLRKAKADGYRGAAKLMHEQRLLDDPPGFAKNRYEYAQKVVFSFADLLRAAADKIEAGEKQT